MRQKFWNLQGQLISEKLAHFLDSQPLSESDKNIPYSVACLAHKRVLVQ